MQQWLMHDGRVVYSIPVITFTPRVNHFQRKAFISGIQKWNKGTHGGIPWQEIDYIDRYLYDDGYLVMGHCQPFVVIDVVKSSNRRIKNQDKKTNRQTLGLIIVNNECGTTRIWMVEDRIPDMTMFSNIAAHEFGHALGLEHISNDKRTLMNEYYSSKKCKGCMTFKDAEEFCDKYDCDPETLATCK